MSLNGYKISIYLSVHAPFFEGIEHPEDERIAVLTDWSDLETVFHLPAPKYVPYPFDYDRKAQPEAFKAYDAYNYVFELHHGVRRAIFAALNHLPLSGDRHVFWSDIEGDKGYGYYAVAEIIA